MSAWNFLILVALYAGVCSYVLNVTITPTRKILDVTPAQLGFAEAQDLAFSSAEDGLRLRGWLVPSTGTQAVILLHGIHSHAWDGAAPEVVRAYVEAGFHVLLFDLRAHGTSDGEHVGLGWLERGDVRAAVHVLLDRGFASGDIGIHGTSYGAATALLAAAEIEELGAVIADSAFADVRDVIANEIRREIGLPIVFGEALLPGLSMLARLLYAVDMTKAVPERSIRDVSPRPILLIHGTEDTVIPFREAQRLKAAGGAEVELWALSGLDHTEGVRRAPDYARPSPTRERFLRRITEFLRGALLAGGHLGSKGRS